MTIEVPILTYHSAQVSGTDYTSNDHVALHDDLRVVDEEGFRVVPLSWVVEWLRGERTSESMRRTVALTFDDGCSMDFHDMRHPRWGLQRGFMSLLREFQQEVGIDRQPSVHATAFVIASPATRSDLGHKNLAGPEWISDDWWAKADRSALLAIESHSWDHNHPSSTSVCQRNDVRGRFDNIETFEECENEVRRSAEHIATVIGRRPRLFAYPWGQSSEYLRRVYFPRFGPRHGYVAAFSAHDGVARQDSDIWAIPRLVHGANWRSTSDLRKLLREAS